LVSEAADVAGADVPAEEKEEGEVKEAEKHDEDSEELPSIRPKASAVEQAKEEEKQGEEGGEDRISEREEDDNIESKKDR